MIWTLHWTLLPPILTAGYGVWAHLEDITSDTQLPSYWLPAALGSTIDHQGPPRKQGGKRNGHNKRPVCGCQALGLARSEPELGAERTLGMRGREGRKWRNQAPTGTGTKHKTQAHPGSSARERPGRAKCNSNPLEGLLALVAPRFCCSLQGLSLRELHKQRAE
jgi:hypothetical protein